jgi:hypothetical protein
VVLFFYANELNLNAIRIHLVCVYLCLTKLYFFEESGLGQKYENGKCWMLTKDLWANIQLKSVSESFRQTLSFGRTIQSNRIIMEGQPRFPLYNLHQSTFHLWIIWLVNSIINQNKISDRASNNWFSNSADYFFPFDILSELKNKKLK